MTDSSSRQEQAASCRTPLGWVTVRVADGCIRAVGIGEKIGPSFPAEGLAREACQALERWLAGGSWPTGLPLAPAGTPFQQRVWEALLRIPPGCRVTYGELARRLGTAPRAVGGACRANPIPLFIPCHRVVAASGDGGFAGHTSGRWMTIKRWLLEHE